MPKNFEIGMVIRAIDKATGPLQGIIAKVDKMTNHAAAATAKASKAAGRNVSREIGAGVSGGIKSAFGAAAGAIAAVGAVERIYDGFKSAVSAASDLNETLSKTQQVFGKNTRTVDAFAKRATTSFGMTRQAALDFSSSFGLILQAGGTTGKQSAEMSVGLAKLSADLASFFNTDIQTAADKLKSGLVGEAEPLREFGVLLSETAVKSKALAMGFKPVNGQLTEAAKVQARYAIILEQTQKAQGDFARTSGGQANMQRIIQAQLQEISAQFGQVFLPAVLRATRGVKDFLGNILDAGPQITERFGGAFAEAEKMGQRLTDWLQRTFGESIDNAKKAFDGFDLTAFGESFSSWAPMLEDLGGKVIPKLGTMIGQIGRWVGDMWIKSQPGLRAIADGFKPILNSAFRLWDKVLAPLFGWLVGTAVPWMVNTIGPEFKHFGEDIGAALDWLIDLISNVGQLFDNVTRNVDGFWQKLWPSMQVGWTVFENSLTDAWNGMWDGLFGWIGRKWDEFIRPIAEFGKKLGIGLPDASAGVQEAQTSTETTGMPGRQAGPGWLGNAGGKLPDGNAPVNPMQAGGLSIQLNPRIYVDPRTNVTVRSVLDPVLNGAVRR